MPWSTGEFKDDKLVNLSQAISRLLSIQAVAWVSWVDLAKFSVTILRKIREERLEILQFFQKKKCKVWTKESVPV
jgi:hypothetical protein